MYFCARQQVKPIGYDHFTDGYEPFGKEIPVVLVLVKHPFLGSNYVQTLAMS